LTPLYRHCPRCGADSVKPSPRAFGCARCGLHLHLNAAVAVAAILTDPSGRVLLIRRGREPGKGDFSVPGGFVDPGESAEDALRREVREEVNLDLADPRFLCSFPNRYAYRGVAYPVVDLVFTAGAVSWDVLRGSDDEVDELVLAAPDTIPLDRIAFPSIRKALERFVADRRAEGTVAPGS
jgi:ADP-ribose pyrophosphatase YjhB (NUDIX family)